MNEQQKVEAELAKLKSMGTEAYLKQTFPVRYWVIGAVGAVGFVLGALIF